MTQASSTTATLLQHTCAARSGIVFHTILAELAGVALPEEQLPLISAACFPGRREHKVSLKPGFAGPGLVYPSPAKQAAIAKETSVTSSSSPSLAHHSARSRQPPPNLHLLISQGSIHPSDRTPSSLSASSSSSAHALRALLYIQRRPPPTTPHGVTDVFPGNNGPAPAAVSRDLPPLRDLPSEDP